jgi:hypothetical protein
MPAYWEHFENCWWVMVLVRFLPSFTHQGSVQGVSPQMMNLCPLMVHYRQAPHTHPPLVSITAECTRNTGLDSEVWCAISQGRLFLIWVWEETVTVDVRWYSRWAKLVCLARLMEELVWWGWEGLGWWASVVSPHPPARSFSHSTFALFLGPFLKELIVV